MKLKDRYNSILYDIKEVPKWALATMGAELLLIIILLLT